MWNEKSTFIREKNIHFQEVNESLIILNPTAGKSHELNESGVFLWNLLEEGKSYADLVKALSDSYDVSDSQANEDLSAFLNEMKTQNLLIIND
jgi:hypothetical protein